MKLILLVGFAAILSACGEVKHPAWKTAPMDYVCTSAQFSKVQIEADYCNATTGYFGSYCLGSAMIRNCSFAGGPTP
ncbi:MAG: hypothetical protein Q8L60_10895 [Gammaproteobacteria bacterium]|nr:hypothetical protein [Gammaproteobacteria bacterium]MDP2346854.1 hypothetical protein [Gammaproteobacteria bacterium]